MIAYRDATAADGTALGAMAAASFTATFGTLYQPRDLATFLGEAFGPAGLPAHAADPRYTIRVATDGAAIIGFAKLGPVVFPGEWAPQAIELHQLYVLDGWHGAGVGPALMDWAIDAARAAGSPEMILSVYVDNHRARRFYERRGFAEIGRYTFMVGDKEDDDRIMRLAL